ncbi:MAG: hypothetical protein WAO58_01315 [Fimbriimonadaceae bacterium]
MRTILSLIFCLAIAAICAAQPVTEQTKHTEAMLNKVKQLDVMNQILPMLMTKEQIKNILPSVEKARARVKAAQNKEYTALKAFEARLNEAYKKAIETGQTPGRALQAEIIRMFQEKGLERMLIAEENTDLVVEALKKHLNAGQIKAATNALDPKVFDPSLKPEEMTSEQKLRFFVKEIFLDPVAYDVLILLGKGT